MNRALLAMLKQASRDRPVTRQEIRAVYHVDDRGARGMIEQLRDQGYPVIGVSSQEGYWMATSKEELEIFLRNYVAKARTIEKRAAKMCRKYNEYQKEIAAIEGS